MPTGYTAGVCEGTETFEEYVWRCTRAMGVMLHMRDDNLGTKFTVPDGTWGEGNPHRKRRDEAAAELASFSALPRKQQVERVRDDLEERIESSQGYVKRCRAENAKIDAVAAKVMTLDPPTKEHVGLIEFMNQQLNISRNDTQWSSDDIKSCRAKLNAIDDAVDEHIANLRSRLARASNDADQWDRKHGKQPTKREWLQALNKVVPCPPHMATPEFLEWIS